MVGYFGNVNLLLKELKTDQMDWSYIIETKKDPNVRQISVVRPDDISTPPGMDPLTFQQLSYLEGFNASRNMLKADQLHEISLEFEYKLKDKLAKQDINLESISRLLNTTWINDDVLFAFGKLFIESEDFPVASVFVTNYFVANLDNADYDFQKELGRIFKNIKDVYKIKRLFFPVLVRQSHWILIVFNFNGIDLINSITFDISDSMDEKPQYLDLRRLLIYEMGTFLSGLLNKRISVRFVKDPNMKTPLQPSVNNCGVSVMTMMHYLKNGNSDPGYNGEDLGNYFRKKWLYELLVKLKFQDLKWVDKPEALPVKQFVESI